MEQRASAEVLIDLWKGDAALQGEFASFGDFLGWLEAEEQRLLAEAA